MRVGGGGTRREGGGGLLESGRAGGGERSSQPVSAQTFIAGMKDEVVILTSLMKPKKIVFVGR